MPCVTALEMAAGLLGIVTHHAPHLNISYQTEVLPKSTTQLRETLVSGEGKKKKECQD